MFALFALRFFFRPVLTLVVIYLVVPFLCRMMPPNQFLFAFLGAQESLSCAETKALSSIFYGHLAALFNSEMIMTRTQYHPSVANGSCDRR